MALLADIDDSYTKTGKGMFTRWSNFMAYLPPFISIPLGGLGKLPFVRGTITGLLGLIDTVIETSQYLFRGQFGNAATALAAGAVGTTVNALTESSPFWWANAASGVTTGASIGTHARAATEAVIGAVTRPLGMEPQVLKSYPAGIGSINAGQIQSGPGKFAAGVSAQRGENANAAYARYMSGEGGVHVNELQSANGRGA